MEERKGREKEDIKKFNDATYRSAPGNDGSSSSKRVLWADDAGYALTKVSFFCKNDRYPQSSAFNPHFRRLEDEQQTADKTRPEDDGWTEVHYKRKRSSSPHFKKSYKEVLLLPVLPLRSTPSSTTRSPLPVSRSTRRPLSSLDRNFFKGRCYRCLSRHHWASSCREPTRCARCFKTGHKARSCMNRLPMAVYRAMRARPAYLNAFVPLSEDFFARQNRRRNAILVDVVPPANLGHFPQDTIANGLASRFGGYPTDFHVARTANETTSSSYRSGYRATFLSRGKSLVLKTLD
uniref:CCHC-type domain-containing protein n=1 Tax=Ananas comosus var. bracteatus TaxID=296719 RepID=A0A6V7NWN1_ANACO|nr:unnamed protein product [Ananas comosus var. bracteatus]